MEDTSLWCDLHLYNKWKFLKLKSKAEYITYLLSSYGVLQTQYSFPLGLRGLTPVEMIFCFFFRDAAALLLSMTFDCAITSLGVSDCLATFFVAVMVGGETVAAGGVVEPAACGDLLGLELSLAFFTFSAISF